MYSFARSLLTVSVFFVYSLVAACSSEASGPLGGNAQLNDSPQSFKEVVIFSVNDVHGRIDNFGKVKHIIDEARTKYQSVYFVSAGDLFSGNPIVDFHPEKGYPLIDLLSKSGLDVNVIGNHEFDYGHTNQLYGYSLNNKFMVMSGKHLETMGKTTLKLFDDGRISYEFEVIDLMAAGPEDPEMLTLIEQYNNRPEFYETIDPFGNGFEAYELSVAALEDLLEQIDVSFSYSSDFTLERSGDQIELLQNGVPLSNDRLVTLALNDYLTNEFAELFGEPTLTYELTTADYLIQYLKTLSPGPINYEDCER